jgi:hypothetical protein
VHIINLPNRLNKISILKIVILADSKIVFKFHTIEEADFGDPITLRTTTIFERS